MSYDLVANNKKAKMQEFTMSLFWPIMLEETGMGYVIGYGGGRAFGSHVYQPRLGGASPVSNDGYPVTAKEAKMMAAVCRGYVSVQRFVNKEWEGLSALERERQKEQTVSPGRLLYRSWMHEDRLKQVETFIEFAENSGGFKVK